MARKDTESAKKKQDQNRQNKPGLWYEIHARKIVILLAFITYAATLSYGYVYLDDDVVILDNFSKISELQNVPGAFLNGYGFVDHNPYYRPITTISFMLNAVLGGRAPFIYHFTNLALHVGCSLILLLILLRLRLDKLLAMLTAGLFATHPLNANTVSWIAGRNDLLAAFFVLLAFYFLIGYLQSSKPADLYWHGFFVLMGMLSKESAVFFPLLGLSYTLLTKKETISKSGIKSVALVYFVCLLIFTALRLSVITDIPVIIGLQAMAANYLALLEGTAKVFLPHIYPPLPYYSNLLTISGIILLSAILTLPLYIKTIRRPRYYGGMLWFLIFLVPGMLVLYPDQQERFDYLDCRIYLPLAGLLFSLATAIPAALIERIQKHSVVAALVISSFGILAYINSGYYADPKVFSEQLIKTNPDKSFSYRKAADFYFQNENFNSAAVYYTKAIQLEPEKFLLYKNLALSYSIMHRFTDAADALEKAKKLNPGDWEIDMGLAKLSFAQKDYKGAFEKLKPIWSSGKNPVELKPLYIDLFNALKNIDSADSFILYEKIKQLSRIDTQ